MKTLKVLAVGIIFALSCGCYACSSSSTSSSAPAAATPAQIAAAKALLAGQSAKSKEFITKFQTAKSLDKQDRMLQARIRELNDAIFKALEGDYYGPDKSRMIKVFEMERDKWDEILENR